VSVALAAPPRQRGDLAPEPSISPRHHPRLRVLAVALPPVLALAVWWFSLRHVDISNLGSYGLTPALPITWYLALFLSLVGAVTAISRRRPSAVIALASVVVVATILYGTAPVLSAQPHYAWVYKHIGVVRYLEAHGQANPGIDIYNRWPGFFALGAIFSRIAGRADPETYAGWAELFFVVLDIVLVMAAVKAIARELRIAAGAALLFLLTNWVGQTYFSPQAFTFVLGLGLTVIMLRHLRVGRRPYSPRLGRLLERLGRVRQLPVVRDEAPQWPRWAAIAAVLILDAVIVASHQLTPYMLLGSTALLMLAGVVRPWWVLMAMAVMTFGYFAANLNYIKHNFGLFTSIDPFNNVQVATYTQTPSPGKVFNTRVELLAIAALWGGGSLASIRLVRRGLLVRALPLLVLAVSPLAVIFGQNYGGEASLRIILFSSPWWSALIAWALTTISGRWLRWVLTVLVAVTFTSMFVPSFFGQEELNLISPAEVRASEHFYYHARRGSVLVLAAPGFPFKYGGTYPEFRGPEGDAYPNLLSAHDFQNRQLGAGDVANVIARIRQYAPHGYLAFTKDETAYAEVLRITPPGALAHLEAAVASSPHFRLWYANHDARIYELVLRVGGTGQALGHRQPAPPSVFELSRRTAAYVARTLVKAVRRARHHASAAGSFRHIRSRLRPARTPASRRSHLRHPPPGRGSHP
jgi:hypothetical protein